VQTLANDNKMSVGKRCICFQHFLGTVLMGFDWYTYVGVGHITQNSLVVIDEGIERMRRRIHQKCNRKDRWTTFYGKSNATKNRM